MKHQIVFLSKVSATSSSKCRYEPTHDKTNSMPAKTQIILGVRPVWSDSLGIRPVWSESLLSAWRKLGSLATHWVHSKDWLDWADAQADLSLCWAHCHFFVLSWGGSYADITTLSAPPLSFHSFFTGSTMFSYRILISNPQNSETSQLSLQS